VDLIPDVSNYQGNPDWGAVIASGRVGGICKASEGLTYVDPTFSRNWKVLGDLNAVRGAYHFARPDKAVPESQADKFLNVVASTKATDILVLDLEVGTGDLGAWAYTFLSRVQAKTGIKPWLYSYAPFIRAHLTDQRLASFPLWLAAYQTSPPLTPKPWQSWQLWQHTDKANIPGIRGLCDESMGTLLPTQQQVQVKPMYDPPLTLEPIVADLKAPVGAWLLAKSGAIYAFGGAPFKGAANGQDYFTGRQAARLEANGDGYTIIATSGERYDFP
jgi:GH25 family lysozyme M1 (1,4-beta-N-acetylmuramidase)